MKKTLAALALVLSTSCFATTNMLIPILNCELTDHEIAKLKDSGDYAPKGFTLLAQMQDFVSGNSGRAVLAYSSENVGSVSSNSREDFKNVSSAVFGSLEVEALGAEELQDGVLFTGELVDYNYKYKWVPVLSIKVDNNDPRLIHAEVRNEPKGESDYVTFKNYNCRM